MNTEGTTPAYKVGDIANGHRLTDQDGELVWLPVEPVKAKAKKKSKMPLWFGLAALIIVIIVIGNAVSSANRGTTPVADDKPAAVAEAPAEPVKTTVPDVTSMTAVEAAALLRTAGFEVAGADDPKSIVTATTPAVGGIAEEGSTVTLTTTPGLTLEQENALGQAQQYIGVLAFSRQGLIDQMTSDYGSGYPAEVATWAVDALGADWNAEAAEAAKQYLDAMSFSRDGLYDQLTSAYGGQFTPEQANAGLAAVGY